MEDSPVIFIGRIAHPIDLIDAAKKIFSLLGVTEWEERQSSNYPPNGHYAIAYALNASVKIFDSYEDRLIDYPFALAVYHPRAGKGSENIPTEPSEIATLLADGGFKVLVPEGDWELDGWEVQGTKYPS